MSADDPLALPPVPPPAPARPTDRAIVVGFVVALLLPIVAMLALPPRETLVFEQRLSAPWPAWSLARGWRELAASFERAYNDRFGGRTVLVRIHHATKALLFHTSPVPNVMLANDGWMYWLGEDGRALDRHYRGTVPYPDEAITAFVAELKRRNAYLAAKGIPYVVTIVPEKYTIYPEHLPGWVTRMPRTPLDRAIDAIRADGTLRFVDLRPALREAKARDRLYYQTDSHWNVLGALVAYDQLMPAVLAALPPAKRPETAPVSPRRPPYVPGVDRYSGDLTHFISLPRIVHEPDFASLGKVLADAPSRCAREVYVTPGPFGEGRREEFRCDRAPALTLLMFRDSMAIPLVPFIAENFRRSIFITSRRLDPSIVEKDAPDVVVEEMVERAISAPATSPMPAVQP